MQMTKTIIWLILIASLSSCGSLKRNKEKRKVETVMDSTVERHTEVTESIDTTITTPADTVQGERNLDEILQGDSLIIEDQTLKVVLRYNAATKKIKAEGIAKPKQIAVQMNRKTVSDEKVQVRKESKEETKRVNTDKEGMFPNWLRVAFFIGIFCMGAIVLWRFILFILPKKKEK